MCVVVRIFVPILFFFVPYMVYQAHVKGVGSVESMISLRDQMRKSNYEMASNNLAMVCVSSS